MLKTDIGEIDHARLPEWYVKLVPRDTGNSSVQTTTSNHHVTMGIARIHPPQVQFMLKYKTKLKKKKKKNIPSGPPVISIFHGQSSIYRRIRRSVKQLPFPEEWMPEKSTQLPVMSSGTPIWTQPGGIRAQHVDFVPTGAEFQRSWRSFLGPGLILQIPSA